MEVEKREREHKTISTRSCRILIQHIVLIRKKLLDSQYYYNPQANKLLYSPQVCDHD